MSNSQTGQVGKMLGEKWKHLSDTDRKPYEDKAAADKKRYEEEKNAYHNVSARCLTLRLNNLWANWNWSKQQAADDEEESS